MTALAGGTSTVVGGGGGAIVVVVVEAVVVVGGNVPAARSSGIRADAGPHAAQTASATTTRARRSTAPV